MRFDIGKDSLFCFQPLGHCLNDKAGINNSFGNGAGKVYATPSTQGCRCQTWYSMISIRHDRIDLAHRIGVGIKNNRINAILDESCNPTATNNTAANDGDLLKFIFRHGGFSLVGFGLLLWCLFSQVEAFAHRIRADN